MIQRYYLKEPKFNGVISSNKLPKIKDRAYLINLDEYRSIHAFYKKFWNEPQKGQNLKKMLRNSPASNAWAAIFEDADFSESSLSYKIEQILGFFLIYNFLCLHY